MKNLFEQYPVIKFEDIRKGDTIVAVHKDSNALKTTMGVADMQANYGSASDYWYTEGGAITLVNSAMSNTTIHLVDRPKPKLPTETGAVILIKQFDGVVLEEPLVSVLDAYGDWFIPKGDDNKAVNLVWLCGKPEREKVQDWVLVELKEVTA